MTRIMHIYNIYGIIMLVNKYLYGNFFFSKYSRYMWHLMFFIFEHKKESKPRN